MDQRKELADGRGVVASAEDRISLWGHLAAQFPLTAAAAKRLLSVQVTSCSSERFWSVMGLQVSQQRAKMIAAIRCAKGGRPSAHDEEVCLTYTRTWRKTSDELQALLSVLQFCMLAGHASHALDGCKCSH